MICWPSRVAASMSMPGVISQPGGLGWVRSHPAERKKRSIPAGVQHPIALRRLRPDLLPEDPAHLHVATQRLSRS
jgi:hypothetical protein